MPVRSNTSSTAEADKLSTQAVEVGESMAEMSVATDAVLPMISANEAAV
jgi:hypothetical protein